MIGLLFILAIIGAVIYFSRADKKKRGAATGSQLNARNQEWIDFIAGYGQVAQDPKEKALVARMLQDISVQNLGSPSPGFASSASYAYTATAETAKITPAAVAAEIATQAASQQQVEAAAIAQAEARNRQEAAKVQLDNTSLLLYFGAFLFVASVGLFVGLGKAGGTLRTMAVLAVLVIMYSSGVWLFRNRPKLQQAGLAFAGIGIVIAPLVGAAVYNYMTDQQYGNLVWLLTSVLCMGLYAHALVTFKKPLLSYLLIFTFLSLFESGIGVVGAPVYYLVWGVALVGILLQLLNRWKGYWPELRESSRMSAQVLLPLSLLASAVMVTQQGVIQLAVTFFLAAAFYLLEALSTETEEQAIDAVVAQVSALAGVAVLAYGISHEWWVVALSLLVANAVQVVVMLWARAGVLWQNFGSVLLVASIIDIALSFSKPTMLLASVIAAVLVGAFIWWKQRRAEAYAVAALAWGAIPYVYGQSVMQPHMSITQQAWWATAAVVGLLVAYVLQKRKVHDVSDWAGAAAATYIIAAVVAVATATMAGALCCFGVTALIVASLVLLAEYDKDSDWAECAALFLIAPLLRTTGNHGLFLITTAGSLLVLMAMSLRYRRESLRWASTLVWLVLPVAIGRYLTSYDWSATTYAYAYTLSMLGLVLSRAIARGVVFVSGKIPLTSYARTASLSYVVGYWFAAALAVVLSLFSEDGQMHTSIILGVLALTIFVLSRWVEKRDDLLALLPFVAQGLLLSIVRPEHEGTSLYVYVLSSSALAVASYAVGHLVRNVDGKNNDKQLVLQAALASAFVAPLAFMFGESIWPLPLSLFIAGSLLMYHLWNGANQGNRELAGGVIALSLLWFLGVFHVEQVQAYVHVIVAVLGLYAYWRATRHETKESDSYLWAMLIMATVPLAFQALDGAAGGLYGYWLLLEQVAIMLLGITIQKSFVTRWGLYVALGAVLYQLRNLGYAALAVLALFLIGLAIYRLQKHDQDK